MAGVCVYLVKFETGIGLLQARVLSADGDLAIKKAKEFLIAQSQSGGDDERYEIGPMELMEVTRESKDLDSIA